MPNQNFYLLSATNVALSLSNWNAIATDAFDNSGDFTITNGLNPNAHQQFYILQLQ